MPKGQATCEVFQLDRGVLVRGRRNACRITPPLIKEWRHAHDQGDAEGVLEWRNTVWEQPTADVVHAMSHQAVAPGAKDVFADGPGTLSLLADERVRAGLLGTP
ncbi:hypothetical protein SUDANB145_05272 [Streptomyces sp. enrichment culture]|uniref:hypothetical protein n=1 Tax=Streptomyces sp. enrichment culture TaxID=1795815 RepID=UPI003F560F0A